MMRKKLILMMCFVSQFAFAGSDHSVFIEAESFDTLGGWVIDQQSWEVIGSSYIMAHGNGVAVEDAQTSVEFPETGTYHVWVRTRDWAPYPVGPGHFKLRVHDQVLETDFGIDCPDTWHWQYGGTVNIEKAETPIALQDQTGFAGRCDALYFSTEQCPPVNTLEELTQFRKLHLGLPPTPPVAGQYDLVVVGGGMAGICSSVRAARLGLDVALIQNRPVLGGNHSSEVRVHLVGSTSHNLYPKLGEIVNELTLPDPENANVHAEKYGDAHKLNVVKSGNNIALFLNTHVYDVKMNGDTIEAVIGRNIRTNEETLFKGRYFADCTGDGTVGFLAGADYRVGRESRDRYNEPLAPDQADDVTLGSSNLWNAVKTEEPTPFPLCPWAINITEQTHLAALKSKWYWESGFGQWDTIYEAEQLRDHNFRAIYGNWAYLKNQKPEKYSHYKLNWVAYISGKRESRRLLGDHILTQHDIDNRTMYPDSCVTGTWSIDLHYPEPENAKYYPGKTFISATKHHFRKPYHMPYRCLYSRNIDNLFMAGRHISASHVAFGSTRVQKTTGMMGEVVGYAAYVAAKHETTPRGVYQNHLEALLDLFR